jgi:TM2 domain-containing membrane protein YozV
LLPPVYFFSRKRVGAGIFSALLFAVSIPLLFFGIGFIIWFANALWAGWSLRYELMAVQAQQIADSLAKTKKDG